MPVSRPLASGEKHGGNQPYEQTDCKKRARGSRTVDVLTGDRVGSQVARRSGQQPDDVYGGSRHSDNVAVGWIPRRTCCGSCGNRIGMGDRDEKTLGLGGRSCSVVPIWRGFERLADTHAWMASTSAHARLHRYPDTGDHSDAGVSRCWRLVDKTFCRAKTCLHVTVDLR